MGKGSKWRKGHSHKEVSEGIERVHENEKKNPSIDLNTHKKEKTNRDGSKTFIY